MRHYDANYAANLDYDPYEGPTGFVPGPPLPGDPAHVRIFRIGDQGGRVVMRRSYSAAKADAYCQRLNTLQSERDARAYQDAIGREAHDEAMLAESQAAYDAALAEEYANTPPPTCWDCGVMLTAENARGSCAICKPCEEKTFAAYAKPRGDKTPW